MHLERHHPDRWRIEMSATVPPRLTTETKLALCYVALMVCAAIIVGLVIHDLNLPALCR